MSQSEPGTREDVDAPETVAGADGAAAASDADERTDESREAEDGAGAEPDIEEDLFEEELRIDGICGVY